MSSARFIVADVLEGLARLEAGSVDLILTSPPFLALRDYLPDDHPDKGKEIGAEATPGAFIDRLLDVVEACDRVLAPHGSLVLELGDTYAGSGGAGGDYNENGLRDGQPAFIGSSARRRDARTGWPPDKSLALIPQAFALALAYGRNPHTGRATEPWRVRNYVAWCRPNPPTGELRDKFRPATSYLTIACQARDRYFDLDGVRHVNTRAEETYARRLNKGHPGYHTDGKDGAIQNPLGAPPLDWWIVSNDPYEGAHYATWPRELLLRPIKAMCPESVCVTCGEPRRRLVRKSAEYEAARRAVGRTREPNGQRTEAARAIGHDADTAEYETVGWTDCGHETWRRGVVLDPFAGTGTTLLVATGHGRDAVGIDLDSRNLELARARLGMFLEVDDLGTVDTPAL